VSTRAGRESLDNTFNRHQKNNGELNEVYA